MITIRPSLPEDAHEIFTNLGDFTRDELDNCGISDQHLYSHLQDVAASPDAMAVLLDGKIAVLAASSALKNGARQTSFFAAACERHKITFAARRWAALARAMYPGVGFVSVSYSRHPARDRFLAALGMRKIDETPRYCVFADSNYSLDTIH
jgi:hypothetical protein